MKHNKLWIFLSFIFIFTFINWDLLIPLPLSACVHHRATFQLQVLMRGQRAIKNNLPYLTSLNNFNLTMDTIRQCPNLTAKLVSKLINI